MTGWLFAVGVGPRLALRERRTGGTQMATVELREYQNVCRRLGHISLWLVLLQTAVALLIFFLCVSRPVFILGYLGIEDPRRRPELQNVILTSLLIWSTGYLWLLFPCWWLLGGIRVYCPRCDRTPAAHFFKQAFYCPACQERFDNGTIAHLAEISTGERDPPRAAEAPS
jgi:hypothetical protein